MISPRKRRQSCFFIAAFLLFLRLPCISYSPFYSPPRSRFIMISPRDKKRRGKDSSTSFSKEMETNDCATFLSLALPLSPFPSFPLSSSFSSQPPYYHHIGPDVCSVRSVLQLVFAVLLCHPRKYCQWLSASTSEISWPITCFINRIFIILS